MEVLSWCYVESRGDGDLLKWVFWVNVAVMCD